MLGKFGCSAVGISSVQVAVASRWELGEISMGTLNVYIAKETLGDLNFILLVEFRYSVPAVAE